jgi:hypothetical protein
LTRRGAALLALVCLAAGAVPVLGGLGVLPIRLENGTPGWVAVAAGSMFLLAGGAFVVDALAGGTTVSGELPPGTSAALRTAQSSFAFGIVVLFAVVTSWIAFGKGERHFTTTLSLPFMWRQHASSDTSGRWAFGAAAVLLWTVVIAICLKVLRRLAAAGQRP